MAPATQMAKATSHFPRKQGQSPPHYSQQLKAESACEDYQKEKFLMLICMLELEVKMSRGLFNLNYLSKVINNLALMNKAVAEAVSKIFEIEEKNHLGLMVWAWGTRNLSRWQKY